MKPNLLFMQMNYQSMWNTGVRETMVELLEDPAFRQRVEQEAGRGAAYSPVFAELLQRWKTGQAAKAAGSDDVPGAAGESGVGARMENSVRERLAGWKVYQDRMAQRDALIDLLYRERIYFLQISPSTARSINEVRLTESHAALEAIANRCREAGIRLVFLRVPVNPKVSLYRLPRDKSNYEEFLADLSQHYGIRTYDLERIVPADAWGLEYNGPDPLHLSRAGHRMLAEVVTPLVVRELDAIH